MKITRNKKSHKTLTFFATNFNYREPYQVLVDATFCQAALQHKVIVDEQLMRYFQCPVKLLTTQCIILEAESLPLVGATMIVKQFYVHKCGHEGKPVSAAECIKSMTKDSRYIIASQDRALQGSLRRVPGRCLLYLHKATPVLETPSDASKKYVLKKSQELLPAKVEKKIEYLKKSQGLPSSATIAADDADRPQKKHRGPKNPNPLSCKKSKKLQTKPAESQSLAKSAPFQLDDKSKTPMKAKRKRVKVPAHVKAAIKGSSV